MNDGRHAKRRGLGWGGAAAALAGLCALAGCNPVINGYRNIRGLTRDDPNPATTPFVKNFAAAEAKPYPNLATVPGPPTNGSSFAARQKLIGRLARSRSTVEASAAALDTGRPVASAPLAAPPPLPPGAAAGNPPAPPGAKPPQIPALRKPSEPPAPAPLESRLVTPRISALPQPEMSRPAPAAAHLPAIAVPPPPKLPSEALAVAGFQPAPPPPHLAPLVPPPAAGAKPAAATKQVATLRFSGETTQLPPAAAARLAEIVALYRKEPAAVRVIGYAGKGGGARRQLARFRTALDRAQAVATALAKAGIPAARIAVEAAPAAADSQGGRAEVLFAR